jgi:DNA-directed RNA polymerase subunit N (RpoN/RPB10)
MPSQEGKIRGEGRKAIDVLKEMGIKRCCCRIKFLSLPLIPMIDRSKARFFDDVQKTVISEDTRELGFGVDPPDFPVL